MKVAFLGNYVPDHVCVRYGIKQHQVKYYQENLIKGIESALMEPVYVISQMPSASYPVNRILFTRSETHVRSNGGITKVVPYVNITLIKQLTLFLSYLYNLIKWSFKTGRRNKKVVLVYGLVTPQILSALIGGFLTRISTVVMISDLPYDEGIKWSIVHKILLKIEWALELRLFKLFDGTIPVTRQIALDYANHAPYIVVEGCVSPEVTTTESEHSRFTIKDQNNEIVIMYSGRVDFTNGLDLLVNAFMLIRNERLRLRIFGSGVAEAFIQDAVKRDARIYYGGFRPNSEVREFQKQADLLVIPRPTNQNFTKYSFPSKLLEYMTSGTPVLTTKLACITEEYFPHLFFIETETPEALSRNLIDISSINSLELRQKGKSAKCFIEENKNWNIQGKRIVDFFETL